MTEGSLVVVECVRIARKFRKLFPETGEEFRSIFKLYLERTKVGVTLEDVEDRYEAEMV